MTTPQRVRPRRSSFSRLRVMPHQGRVLSSRGCWHSACIRCTIAVHDRRAEQGAFSVDQKHHGVGRRDLLLATAAASALGSRQAKAQAAPWALPPSGKVEKLNFVVWTYGDIY